MSINKTIFITEPMIMIWYDFQSKFSIFNLQFVRNLTLLNDLAKSLNKIKSPQLSHCFTRRLFLLRIYFNITFIL